jgi:hypothetical protein
VKSTTFNPADYTALASGEVYTFFVSSPRGVYIVNLLSNSCSCASFHFGKKPCKHLLHISEIIDYQLAFDARLLRSGMCFYAETLRQETSNLLEQTAKCVRAGLLPAPVQTPVETPTARPQTPSDVRFAIWGRLSFTRKWVCLQSMCLTADAAEHTRKHVWDVSSRYSATEVRVAAHWRGAQAA